MRENRWKISGFRQKPQSHLVFGVHLHWSLGFWGIIPHGKTQNINFFTATFFVSKKLWPSAGVSKNPLKSEKAEKRIKNSSKSLSNFIHLQQLPHYKRIRMSLCTCRWLLAGGKCLISFIRIMQAATFKEISTGERNRMKSRKNLAQRRHRWVIFHRVISTLLEANLI